MTGTQVEVIGWIAVVVLAVSAAIWLADTVFTIVEDEDQKKILNRAIGGTFLGGIVAAAVAWFGGDNSGDTPTPKPPPNETAAPGPRDPATPAPPPTGTPTAPPAPQDPETPAPTPTSTATPTPPSTPTTTPSTPAKPEFPAWAEKELPPRPFLPNPPAKTYPTCMRKVRLLAKQQLPRAQADRCFVQLEQYHEDVILFHRDRRRVYLSGVLDQRKVEKNPERFQFLDDERFSFVDGSGTDFRAFADLDQRYTCDSAFLTNIRVNGIVKDIDTCSEARFYTFDED